MSYDKLQFINSKFMSQNTFERWNTVRILVKNMIEQIIIRNPNSTKNILIICAGTCRDLPMDYICKNFQYIVLADIDGEALKISEDYTTKYDNKIKRLLCDVTGLYESGNLYCNEIRGCCIETLESLFLELSSKIRKVEITDIISDSNTFSVIISDLIITQLATKYFESTKGKISVDETPDYFIQLHQELVVQHLKLLNFKCKNKGSILILSDILTCGIDNGKMTEYTKVILSNISLLSNPAQITLDDICTWIEKFGLISGSDFYLSNVDFIERNFLFNDLKWFWWFHTMERAYFCLAHSYEKIDSTPKSIDDKILYSPLSASIQNFVER